MKNACSIVIAFLFFLFSLKAQEFHTPREILEIMDSSMISYVFLALNKPIPKPDLSQVINSNDYYISAEGELVKYAPAPETEKFYRSGLQFYEQKQLDSALVYFQKAYKNEHSYLKALTEAGIVLFEMKEYESAQNVLQRVLLSNPKDYKAHWYLGKIFMLQGQFQGALDRFINAHLLNRNHPGVQSDLFTCLKKLKYDVIDWLYNPQVSIERVKFDDVKVSFDRPWLPTALVMAVWEYEPDYADRWNDPEHFVLGINEKKYYEMMLNQLYFAIEKKYNNRKKYPEFYYMVKAFETKKIDEYVYYEMLLPYYPHIGLFLSDSFMNDIKLYLLDVRFKK